MKDSGCERRKLGSWRPRDDEVDERDYFVDVSAMIQGYVAGAKGTAGIQQVLAPFLQSFRPLLGKNLSWIST